MWPSQTSDISRHIHLTFALLEKSALDPATLRIEKEQSREDKANQRASSGTSQSQLQSKMKIAHCNTVNNCDMI